MRHPVVTEDLREITAAELPWAELFGQTVLVTGANGLVPSYLVETLLFQNEQGAQPPIRVVGLVRDRAKAEARFAAYAGRNDLEFVVQDVCQPLNIDGRLDWIVHAASQATPRLFGSDPVGTLLPNVRGTQLLLERAQRDQSRRFLFLSGGEVYGHVGPEQFPTHEQSFGSLPTTDVRSCYAESKRMGETMCVSWHHQHRVPAVIVRLYHTYGPGMSLTDGRVFADFASDLLHRRNLKLLSDGTARRTFCYLADAARGLFTALLRGTPGEAYNLGEDRDEVSIRELAERLVAEFQELGLRVERTGDRPPEGYLASRFARHVPDVTKLRQLGWKPLVPLEAGFRRTLRSCQ